jgi:O-antigen/teichoic acid export membrane protein
MEHPFALGSGVRDTMATASTSGPEIYVNQTPRVDEKLPPDAADRASMKPSQGATAPSNPESSGLGALFLRGLGWIGAARTVSAVGGVLRYIIFARLLRPFDFGVFGAASIAGSLLFALTDLNLAAALVPQIHQVDEYLDTIWTTALARGVLASLILAAAAKPLARFFQIGDLDIVFLLFALYPMVCALSSPASGSRILRDLKFRTSLVLNCVELGAGFIFGLGAILFWHDWRGLIVSAYAAQISRSALTFYYYPYRPHLVFDYQRARRLFEFGGWVTVRRIADFAARKVDGVAVGHFLGPQVLGEYQFAFRVGELPTFEVAYSIGLVLFPLVSRLDRFRFARLLLPTSVLVAASGIFYAAVIYKWGASILQLTVGAKWLGALPPLYLLCVAGIFAGLLAVGGFCLDGLNEPASSFKISLLSAVVLAALVVPLTLMFGVKGTAAAVIASAVLPLPLMLKLMRSARERME